jgi:TIR domain
VIDINSRERLAAWLREQPREVSTMLGVRWTMRALPLVASYRGDLLSDLVLPCFRVLAASWTAVKYPAHEMKHKADAARTNAARAFPIVARAALVADAIIASDVAITHAATTFAARAFAAAADDDPDARAFAAAAGARAFAAADTNIAAAAFWSAISADATRWERGVAASVIAGSPLWPNDPPVRLRTMWQELKAELHAEKQDWQVWTTWYDDRLEGSVRDEERELAYVGIDSNLWDQGSAIVNAEIKRLVETRTSPPPGHPVALETFIKANTADADSSGAVLSEHMGCRQPVFKGFFSYSHSDAEADPQIVEAFSLELERLVDAKLVNARFEIWREKGKLRAGDYWSDKIETAISSVHIFIILLTSKWISSDYCRNEFEIFKKAESARDAGGYIIPIYARDIEGQAKYLANHQKELYERIKRIQYQQITTTTFARLSANERIELIENAADPICAMLDRLRDEQEMRAATPLEGPSETFRPRAGPSSARPPRDASMPPSLWTQFPPTAQRNESQLTGGKITVQLPG